MAVAKPGELAVGEMKAIHGQVSGGIGAELGHERFREGQLAGPGRPGDAQDAPGPSYRKGGGPGQQAVEGRLEGEG